MTTKTISIIDALKDEELFRPFVSNKEDSIQTWANWFAVLRCLYGLPCKKPKLVRQCTGRDPDQMPDEGFDSALIITGRRCGKSRTAALVGAYEAALAGHEEKLSKGEKGVVPICSPTKKQSRVVRDYIRAIFTTDLLGQQVVKETKEGFELQSGVLIEILSGDYRTVRGYTLLAAIVDEAAFFGLDDESKVRSDTELIRALKPALATVGGKLIAITTPYGRKGWTFKTYEKNHGNNAGRTLVWQAASRTMNPTLSQKIVDDALAEDLQAAKSEFLGEFRDDVGEYLPRAVIEKLVVPERFELLPREGITYYAFCDVSGGRSDDAALAIAHRDHRTVILDAIRQWKPPFSPQEVIEQMVTELRRYHVKKITGDNYAADFVKRAFESCGVRYTKSEKPKHGLYLELLPRLTSGEVELLDDALLVNQLASLERRTRSGGKDIIDHPRGGHDDIANAVAGVVFTAQTRFLIGAF